MPEPIYTRENTAFSCPLQWGLTVFWQTAHQHDDWFAEVSAALEQDGIRLLGHRFASPAVSQFAISTTPFVTPLSIVQRVKGRLQYAVRDKWPKALRGNYALRSFGKVTREVVERYVASQLEHHRLSDPRVEDRFRRYQIVRKDIDLSRSQRTTQGIYWHNLHIVLVHRERFGEFRDEVLRCVVDMILRASESKAYQLSRAGILPDHVHLTLGCPIGAAPGDVALGFLNNLAYVHGLKPVFQFGGFVGTIGEYDSGAVESDTQRENVRRDGK